MYNVFPPTEKQVLWATKISYVLNVDLPEIHTKQSFCEFIRLHDKEARSVINQRRRDAKFERKYSSRRSRRTYPTNGDYAGSHDSDIVDCFDCGIFPWGDS